MIVMQTAPSGNAFSRAPSRQQLFAYSVFVLQALLFYLLWALSAPSLALLAAFSLALLATLSTSLVCSAIDPTDPRIQEYFQSGGVTKQPDEQLLYCEICRSIVSADSKHCLACARCVNGFDHHCKWINNCIGRANYRWFLAMCSSALVMMSCYLANAVLLFSDEKAPQSARICFWVLGGLVLALAVLDFNLLAFHAYLMARGITTYQWILMDSTKEEERVVPKQEQPGDDTMHSVDS